MKHILFIFIDGIGLGDANAEINPFCVAELPTLHSLLGITHLTRELQNITGQHASLVVTDANLGITGRPQSATGQATILTGINVSAQIGEHFGPKPNAEIRAILSADNLFMQLSQAGYRVQLGKAYPDGYFTGIESGKRLYSAIPHAAVAAGLTLPRMDAYANGTAFADDYTGNIWRERLGIHDAPLFTTAQTGRNMALQTRANNLLFYEHWLTDYAGHKRNAKLSVSLLEGLDQTLSGILENWDFENGLIFISSDHGNMEDLSVKTHTRNAVPTILIGAQHADVAQQISSLVDLAPAIKQFLGLA